MRGETITVLRRVKTGVDAGNNAIYKTTEELVGNGSCPRQLRRTRAVNAPTG